MINNKIALLMGGDSEERDISLKSGQQALASLEKQYATVRAFDPIESTWLSNLSAFDPDCVFIALHGGAGENGEIQRILQDRSLIFTGSDSVSSKTCMNKQAAKDCVRAHSRHLSPSLIWQGEHGSKLGYPVFVKPLASGSSCGVHRVDGADAFYSACQDAATYGQVMYEQVIEGVDVCVPVLHDRAMTPIAIHPKSGFYDYEAKYQSESTFYEVGAGLDAEKTEELQRLSLQIFKTLGCRGWGRLDFILTPDQRFFFLEMNTVPGITERSLFPRACAHDGISFDAMVNTIVQSALMEQA